MSCPRWGVYQYDPEEEHPRPEYLAQLETVETRTVNFVTQTTEPRPPFWRMKMPGVLISWASVLFFIMLALVTVVAIILYRMSMIVALSTCGDDEIKYVQTTNINTTHSSHVCMYVHLIAVLLSLSQAFWLLQELKESQCFFVLSSVWS